MEETSIDQDGKFFDWLTLDNLHIKRSMLKQQANDPTAPELVAQRLRFIRAAFDLDKAGLADLIPVDRSSYTKIEKGEKALKPNWAFRIWELYGVPMEYTYRGALDSIPDKLRTTIMQNRMPRD